VEKRKNTHLRGSEKEERKRYSEREKPLSSSQFLFRNRKENNWQAHPNPSNANMILSPSFHSPLIFLFSPGIYFNGYFNAIFMCGKSNL
jgi:hypothetical protein